MRLSGLRDLNLHNITYHYLVPIPYIKLLNVIYNQKQRLLNNNQSFIDYINSNITTRAKIISDLVGNDTRLSISETQCKIVGRYAFDIMPEKPQRDDDLGVWTVEFDYTFTYEKPNMVAMRYPIMVYNELLPREYIAFLNKVYDDTNVNKSYSLSIGSLSQFESPNTLSNNINLKAEYNLPDFDDYVVQSRPTSSVGAFVALCQVNETDLISLLNLNELGDIAIDPDILDFILNSEYPYMNKMYQSMLSVQLYMNENLLDPDALYVDSNLNVIASNELDIRNTFRVRLSLITDISLINSAFFTRLLNYPKAMYKLIAAVNEDLRNNPYLQSIAELPQVTAADFSLLYSKITGLRYLPKVTKCTAPVVPVISTPKSNIYGQAVSSRFISTPYNTGISYDGSGTITPYTVPNTCSGINDLNNPLSSLLSSIAANNMINTGIMKTVETGYILSLRNTNK
jgi:hypothetical protein